MSILIRGVDMPKNCTGCPICCGLPYQHRDEKGRRPDCPLVEIPTPHGRLIDADEIEMPCLETTADQKWMEIAIKSTPTIIEAEGSET